MHYRTIPSTTTTTTITAEQLGLYFPARQLDQKIFLSSVAASWAAYPNSKGSAKTACVFVSGGASGTGKTRFASEIPQLLFNAARESSTSTSSGLVSALRECMERQLVLQADIDVVTKTSMPEALLNAYLSPNSTASVPRFRMEHSIVSVPRFGNVDQVCRFIAACEHAWHPFDGVIAVVIHLDEVQRLLSQQYNEEEAARYLGDAVNSLASVLWAASATTIKLFPIFYVSGLSKTLVYRTASATKPIPIDLPLLSASDCESIVHQVFGLPVHWKPSAALSRALRCIAGPPRLLQLFLVALQAGGSLDTILHPYTMYVDLPTLVFHLHDLKWEVCTPALYRCLSALPKFQLVTFTHNIASGSEHLELFHHIAALVLLREPVLLTAKLAERTTVNDVISNGFAFSQPATIDSQVYLYWPRLYIWAISKVCLFSELTHYRANLYFLLLLALLLLLLLPLLALLLLQVVYYETR